jgi:hypothetical protein
MISGSAVPARPESATKRIVIYWVGVSFAFLAAVSFGFHGKLEAPKNPAGEHGISARAGAVQPRLVASYGKLPLSFEVNQGQTASQVKFLSRGQGYTLFLTDDTAILALRKPSAVSSQRSASQVSGARIQDSGFRGLRTKSLIENRQSAIENELQRTTDDGPRRKSPIENRQSAIENQVVRLRLVGANPNAEVVGADELPGKANYFIGNDPKKWHTTVPTYAKVRYRNVYPGIDLEYYGNQDGQLEYDFVVAPGADPGRITLRVGAHRDAPLRIAPDGDLVISAEGGEVRFHKPVVYQEQESEVRSQEPGSGIRDSGDHGRNPQSKIDNRQSKISRNGRPTTDHGRNRQSTIVNRQFFGGRFRLTATNQVTFEVSGYDKTRPLVIDPVLSYSTYLGGSYFDYGFGIATDSSGNAYVTGITRSSDFPTANPFQASDKAVVFGGQTTFVTKLNASGSALVYSTYLGGSTYDQAQGIAVDSSGNAYVTGYTWSTDFPTVNPLQASLNGGENSPCPDSTQPCSDAFVSKLNASGSELVYSTYLGGTGSDRGYGIAVDSSGDAYVAGQTGSTDFPTANPVQASLKGKMNAFVSKLNASGSELVYSTYLGGSGNDQANGTSVDSNGNAVVVGLTGSTDFPTVNPLQGSNKSSVGTGFVAEVNAAGSALVYSTYLGGSIEDWAKAIAVDSSGNAYVTGYTDSPDFPTVNALQASRTGMPNAFVSKLSPSGSALVYSTYLGGSAMDVGSGAAVDSSGNAYVTGYTSSTDFPRVNAVQASNNALKFDSTGFVAELNASGSALVYSTYLGGSTSDLANAIAVDSSGNAYVTGSAGSTDFPTVNPFQASNKATYGTVFVAELSPGPAPALSFSVPALSFGSLTVDTASPQQSVTVTNLGNAPLSITSITASGDFALVTTDTSCPYGGGTVAPEANCTLDVTFTPTAAGARAGTLTVVDNASGSPHTVQLSGGGLGPTASLSATSLTFAGQLVGIASSAQTVTLQNTGNQAMSINGFPLISTSSGSFSLTQNCGSSLAANASCQIYVTYTPTAGGPCTGALSISDNAPGSPQTVQLSGTGQDFLMSSNGTSQTVTAGETANYSLTVAPEGGLNQTVNLTCSGAPSLATCTLSPSSVTLNGTASAAVTVQVATTAPTLAPPWGRVLPPNLTGLGRVFWLCALLGLASVGALVAARKRRAAYLLGACLLLVLLWSACGGGAQVVHTPGTPAGTYTLDVKGTVTSTAPSATLTHDFQFTLTVQ